MAGRRLTGVVCAVATFVLNLASARKLQQTATTVPTNATYGNTLQTLLSGNASALGKDRPLRALEGVRWRAINAAG